MAEGDPTAGQGGDPRSPIAVELQALIGLGAQWLRSVLPEDHLATGAPECAGCPLCRLIRAVRSDESELAASVAAGVDGAVTAVNAILMLIREHGEPAPDVPAAQPTPKEDSR